MTRKGARREVAADTAQQHPHRLSPQHESAFQVKRCPDRIGRARRQAVIGRGLAGLSHGRGGALRSLRGISAVPPLLGSLVMARRRGGLRGCDYCRRAGHRSWRDRPFGWKLHCFRHSSALRRRETPIPILASRHPPPAVVPIPLLDVVREGRLEGGPLSQAWHLRICRDRRSIAVGRRGLAIGTREIAGTQTVETGIGVTRAADHFLYRPRKQKEANPVENTDSRGGNETHRDKVDQDADGKPRLIGAAARLRGRRRCYSSPVSHVAEKLHVLPGWDGGFGTARGINWISSAPSPGSFCCRRPISCAGEFKTERRISSRR